MILGFIEKETTKSFMNRIFKSYYRKIEKILNKYGKKGVDMLKNATPVLSGKTRDSWFYQIDKKDDSFILSFINTNTNKNVNIAYIIDRGHITNKRTWVNGLNFIDPIIDIINDEINNELQEL